MYTKRQYQPGDRVFFLAKGSHEQGGVCRPVHQLDRRQFDSTHMRAEPLYLMEGLVSSIYQQPDDATGRYRFDSPDAARVDIVYYPYDVPNSGARLIDDASYTDYNFHKDYVNAALSTITNAIGSDPGFIDTEEKWKFALRFLYPEVVVEQGYARLLSDVAAAANVGDRDPIVGDRTQIIKEAERLGFNVRSMQLAGRLARWPQNTVDGVSTTVQEYSWALVGVPRMPPVMVADGTVTAAPVRARGG